MSFNYQLLLPQNYTSSDFFSVYNFNPFDHVQEVFKLKKKNRYAYKSMEYFVCNDFVHSQPSKIQ